MNPIFTIGHSNHEIGTFLNLLALNQIDVVADVRSQPYSRHYPWFCREQLKQSLADVGVRYVFLGAELGARREERECYTNGKVNYDRVAQLDAFHRGLKRLQEGADRHRIALMCAEKDPLDCHRMILVARHMVAFARVDHICYDGTIESHLSAEARLLDRTGFQRDGVDLFRSREEILNDAFSRRGSEIAFVESVGADNVGL